MLSRKILTIHNKIKKCNVWKSSNFTSSSVTKNNQKQSNAISNQENQSQDWRSEFQNISDKPPMNIRPEGTFAKLFYHGSDFTFKHFLSIIIESVEEKQRRYQKFNPERQEILGYNLALAHFLIYQGGKVKFQGQDEWILLNKDKRTVDLPNKYDPKYILTEIDATGIALVYESLDNFMHLPKLTKAIFKGSPYFDDWFVDRIVYSLPQLEYLDISDCPKVTERAMEALYKLHNLKTLIITNHYKTKAFELTCMMLEDCCPKLKIEMLEPKCNKKT